VFQGERFAPAENLQSALARSRQDSLSTGILTL
jgi:hypothetical protein